MLSTPTALVRRIDRPGMLCAIKRVCVEVAVSLNSNDATIWERQGHEWKQTETLAEVCAQYGYVSRATVRSLTKEVEDQVSDHFDLEGYGEYLK